ncbi:MAG: hypothetical protein PHI64_12820 [Zoogloea sp.]|uniref:hypothetical protein n=1 Tax=Zoogloea sp. TaxID=49181 RepID=UPI0026305353|nr:hypothetical protein [Zoogloea sp.]MDD2989831.1 hypothetical protein [Zoogloea sp.]
MPALNPDRLHPRRQRAEEANQLIVLIGQQGRQFFFSEGTRRYAFFEVAGNGRVWFNDEYSGARIYTHKCAGSRIRGFTHGGTLWRLVERMANYITAGTPVDMAYIAPKCWGYSPEAADALRAAASALPITRSTQ